MIFKDMGLAFINTAQNLYAFFTRYAAVRPIAFTAREPIVPPFAPRRLLMLDIAYLVGLLISFGLFYGFTYVCSRL